MAAGTSNLIERTSTEALLPDAEESQVRWERLVGLGMEGGLRDAGFSEITINVILDRVKKAGGIISTPFFREDGMMDRLSEVKDGRSVMLALLGRGESVGDMTLDLNHQWEACWALDMVDATALCVNLRSNVNLRSLDLDYQTVFGTRAGSALLANALRTNSTLKSLSLGSGSLASAILMDNSTLRLEELHLHIRDNDLKDDGIAYVALMLSKNTTVKTLGLSNASIGFKGAEYLSSLLEINTTLEILNFEDNVIGKEGMQKLLTPLSDVDGAHGQKNTTLNHLNLGFTSVHLNLGFTSVEYFSVESVALMIRTNNSLSTLSLERVPIPTRDWVDQIIPALRENQTLKSLLLCGCTQLTGDEVYNALMDLVQFTYTGLEEIDLTGTGMQSRTGRIHEELRVNKEYRGKLRGQDQVTPKSGRLVLCGYEFGGKTTILKTMERLVHGTSCAHRFSEGCKNFMKKFPTLRELLFGIDVHRELTSRTRGMDVVLLSKESQQLVVWDFAGQREYYALHDYLFPEVKNSCFFFVCSPRHPPTRQNPRGEIKKKNVLKIEFTYWLRFIASNSKPQVGHGDRSRLPHITFVLTNKDTLDPQKLNISRQWAEQVLNELKDQFEEVLAVSHTLEVVNAHSLEDGQHLIDLTNDTLGKILIHSTEYAICEEVRNALHTWSAEHPSKPVLSLDEFYHLCQSQIWHVVNPHYREIQEAILTYLNHVGEIIFSKGLDFIVVNPKWFGIGVLGSLINAFRGVGDLQPQVGRCIGVSQRPQVLWKLDHEQGFVRRTKINDLLEHSLETVHLRQAKLSSDKLIELMINLEMCFEADPGNVRSAMFVPALFDDESEAPAKGLRKLEWKLDASFDYIYIGRRLECENKFITFLTPGFFPRLQVHLRNYIHEKGWTQNLGFEVGRNLISFAENGVEVCVEYSGDIDYYVDVLVRASKSYSVALQFMEEHVIKKILDFCASPQGCQGVLLVEAVIRPECVRDLHLCVNRKDQSVLVSILKHHIDTDISYQYTWSHKIEDVKDVIFALDLLEGEGSYKRWVDANQVDQPRQIPSSSRTSDFTYGDLSLSLQQKLPRLFYPTIEDVGMLRKLEGKVNLAKVLHIKLHLMCDHKDGSHKVEGQRGRTMTRSSKDGHTSFPIMKYAISLLWAGVNVGASSAGVPAGGLTQIDKWIQEMFAVPEMPISVDRLREMVGTSQPTRSVSEEETLKVLEKYMNMDPSTQWLKNFLNLDDGAKFFKDFQLYKVFYTCASHQDKIGWLCQRHYGLGLRQNICKSVLH